ncbi:MAG: type II secretion system F family protein [Candidatus Diapherotrites archaeon]
MFDYFFSKKSIELFSEKLSLVKEGMDFGKWIMQSALMGFVLFVALSAAALIIGFEFNEIFYLIAFVFSFLFALVLNYFLWDYLIEKSKREIESMIPEVLLSGAIFSRHSPILELIEFTAKEDFGKLSNEFRKALNEINKGESISNALRNISKRTDSEIIERTINLMVWGYENGAEMNSLFKETAEEILESKAIASERQATMLIEKYTLLIAGGILVPMILGLIVNMISGLNFPSMEGILGGSTINRKELLNAALLSNQIYITEFALISALFVSFTEGNQKKAVIYALVLVPLSLIVFNGVQWVL